MNKDEGGNSKSEGNIDGGKGDIVGCFYLERCEDGVDKRNSGRYVYIYNSYLYVCFLLHTHV
jgi:hypothetical protein